MSRRSLWGAALLSVASALPLQAQLTEADLMRQIDSLAPLVEGAAVEAEAARLARLEAQRASLATRLALDTISVAGMTVITPVPEAAAASGLFEEVWNESFRGFRSRTLGTRTFTYQVSAYDVEEIPVDGVRHQIVVAPWHSRDQVKARIRRSVEGALAAELDGTALGAWVIGSPFTRRDPAAIYRELVLAESQAVRLCLDGGMDACRSALGLDAGGAVPDTWYTPEERRTRVLAWAGYDPVRGRIAASLRWTDASLQSLERCIELTRADACDDLIAQNVGALAPIPVYARETVVARAIEIGGPEAWNRLLEDPDLPAAEALAYAAGVSLAELLSEWQEWVLSNRPEVYAGLGGSSMLALLWVLFFAALAARSTRWRFA